MGIERRTMLKGLGAGSVAGGLAMFAAGPAKADASPDVHNILSAAVAWRVTAAERDMLYRQAFNIACDKLDSALRGVGQQRRGARPLAFISDVDDTVLSSNSYWELLIAAGKQAFDDELWDAWVRENGPIATPGAVEFTRSTIRSGPVTTRTVSRSAVDSGIVVA